MILDYLVGLTGHHNALMREAEGDYMYAPCRGPCEDRQNWSDVATSQDKLTATLNGKHQGTDSPLESPERMGPADALVSA